MGLSLVLVIASFAWANDSCMNRCFLKPTGESGKSSITCNCERASFSWDSKASDLRRQVRARIQGIEDKNVELVASNTCGLNRGAALYTKEELSKRVRLSKQELCDCVRGLLHLQPYKVCKADPLKGKQCSFAYRYVGPSAVMRPPALFDYQYCTSRFINYQPPKTCEHVKCAGEKPECEQGDEIVNIADEGSCCPVFVCKRREP